MYCIIGNVNEAESYRVTFRSHEKSAIGFSRGFWQFETHIGLVSFELEIECSCADRFYRQTMKWARKKSRGVRPTTQECN